MMMMGLGLGYGYMVHISENKTIQNTIEFTQY